MLHLLGGCTGGILLAWMDGMDGIEGKGKGKYKMLSNIFYTIRRYRCSSSLGFDIAP